MIEIKTKILINSTSQKVWSVLMNFENYHQWNPFIQSISGDIIPGKTIKVVIQLPGKKPMTFKPKVLKLDTNKEFRWKGQLIVPRLFDGEHYFRIIENSDNTVELIHGEIFSGLLPDLMKRTLHKTSEGFQLMNMALKKFVENH